MELDDLKLAWQGFESELKDRKALDIALFQDSKQDRVRSALRPLYGWHVAVLLCGIIVALMGASFWVSHRGAMHYLLSGLSLHVYGIALIVCALVVLHRLNQVEYGAPVLKLQEQLLLLEKTYIGCGWILGLPWWVMWIPFALYFAALFGVDLYATQPRDWLWGSLVFGLMGAAGTLAAVDWARRSSKPGRADKLRDALAGASLSNARHQLIRLKAFEDNYGQ
ncbi:MAG: hypothetical protein ACI87W_003536 [Halieaceae bacterium]|jgi:hypothetical protein